ncbi:type II toxin-antitoxin system VapC family toxin [soil metagenome]
MGQEYLIDSNVIINYLAGNISVSKVDLLKSIVNAKPQISVISQIEVLSRDSTEAYTALIEGFLSECHVRTLSSEVVQLTIAIRRKYKLKTPDAIIAATAIHYNSTLITSNIRDFDNIKGLKLLNPTEN